MVSNTVSAWPRRPWLTKEDIRALKGLSFVDGKAFEALLHQQARSDIRYREHTVPIEEIIISDP